MTAPDKTCVIVDGNSLLYRAFYAVKYLSTKDGQPTNALFGLTSMLLKLLVDNDPDAFIVAFDAPEKTFRHEVFADYKATRKETPGELKIQMPIARDIAQSLGALVIEVPGYEADDIVGTCAKRAEACGYNVLIVSGDLDELQLVSDKIRVAVTSKGVSDVIVYSPVEVAERYGMTPLQFIDFKALKGDASDNIPGVPGIGDKTASRLILEYGSIESLLDRLDEMPDGRIKDAIFANQEQLRMSKQLARIVTEMPLEIELSSIRGHHRTPGAAEQLFRKLEFESLLKRLPATPKPDGQAEPPRGGPALPILQVVQTQSELMHLLDILGNLSPICFWLDIGLQGAISRVAFAADDFAVCVNIDNSTVHGSQSLGIDLGEPFVAHPSAFQKIFQSPEILKATHNIKDAQLGLNRIGITLQGCVDDTMLAAFLLQPGRGSYNLDWISLQHLGIELSTDLSADQKAASSGALVYQLSQFLNTRLIEEDLSKIYREIEIPLAPVLARMQEAGVVIDARLLETLSRTLSFEIAKLEEQIYEIAGSEFSIGSTKQLSEILFVKLQLPVSKRTKTGHSTDAETLESLASTYEIAAKVLQWRELTKLRSTYADSLPRLIDPKTHRVHSTLNQTGAATGRLSSSDPNLQNIPIRTELGRQIRSAFVAEPGCELLSADYSQIELRLLAHLSGDNELIRCFRENEDIHVRTACGIFNVRPEDVTENMRRRAKTINFSVIYGKSNFGLAKEFQISVGEAQQYIEGYFAQYPRVKEFNLEVIERARVDGYVSTLYGRKRWFPELHARDRNIRANAERAAFNALLQGTAADIIKLAMIRLDELLVNMPGNMVLQVHDELIFNVTRGCIPEFAPVVKREMENACPLNVPLLAEVRCGENWRDMEKCL